MILNDNTYLKYKAVSIEGRYVVNDQIINFLEDLNADFLIETVGVSVKEQPIKSVTLGSGNKKVLMWSQMHGNESTTTKAVLDLLKFLASSTIEATELLQNCTLKIIPILNPDGAEAYTRVNYNNIDLNRDAQDRSQPESRVLRKVYEDFQPDFCFNLHDQRTIYNVGDTSKPATISFLAPSHDQERSISKTRDLSMKLIAAMNDVLQKLIPGQVGRYDDGFNANCVGDTFQMLDTPTILFEAGHFPEDYQREETRKYLFHAILVAIDCICKDDIQSHTQEAYFQIPENKKLFFDVIIKNAQLINETYTEDITILFTEVLKDGDIHFEGRIEKIGSTEGYFAHRTYDCADHNHLKALKKQSFWNAIEL